MGYNLRTKSVNNDEFLLNINNKLHIKIRKLESQIKSNNLKLKEQQKKIYQLNKSLSIIYTSLTLFVLSLNVIAFFYLFKTKKLNIHDFVNVYNITIFTMSKYASMIHQFIEKNHDIPFKTVIISTYDEILNINYTNIYKSINNSYLYLKYFNIN